MRIPARNVQINDTFPGLGKVVAVQTANWHTIVTLDSGRKLKTHQDTLTTIERNSHGRRS